ncbi:hypothetical protein WMY93_024152, partial [Mugilogobius chulae]
RIFGRTTTDFSTGISVPLAPSFHCSQLPASSRRSALMSLPAETARTEKPRIINLYWPPEEA